MIEFVVKEEDADWARAEVESRTDYKLASLSNSGVMPGAVRLTFLPPEAFATEKEE